MNVIDTMVKGFVRIYKDNNALYKHLFIAIISGIISICSIYLQNISESIEKTKALPDIPTFTAALIILIAAGIFTGGYNLLFCHNAFKDSNNEILPNIDLKPFKIFWNALPLMLCWTFYILCAAIISGILLSGGNIAKIIGLIILLFILFICIFIQFIYIEYTKNFDTNGLFNILCPFKYIKKTIAPLVLLGLLFIPVYIIAMSMSFLSGIIMSIFGIQNLSIVLTIGGVIGGYLNFIVQIVWYYCLVQIYKEKIDNNVIYENISNS